MEQPSAQVLRATPADGGLDARGRCLNDILEAVPNLWQYFSPKDATSVRSTCRMARAQHIAGCRQLNIRLACSKGLRGNMLKENAEQNVRQALDLVRRGYQPQSMILCCANGIKGGVLFAALAPILGASLTSLSLQVQGPNYASLGLPSEPSNWAASIAAALPSLTSVSLDTRTHAEECSARPLLLALAPQLRKLSWVCCWPRRPQGEVLEKLTALQHLELNSREADPFDDDGDAPGYTGRGVAPQCAAAIARLTCLQSLTLTSCTEFSGNAPEDAARELAPLSALSSLTRLVLNTPRPCADDTYRPDFEDRVGCFYFYSWRMNRIVAGMQATFADLQLPASYIRAEDALPLSALAGLTRIQCRGMATPAPAACRGGEAPGASGGGGSRFPLVPLPPNLRTLEVHSLPTLHLAASMGALPSRPRLVLVSEDDPTAGAQQEENPVTLPASTYSYNYSSQLALLGGVAGQHGNALPSPAAAGRDGGGGLIGGNGGGGGGGGGTAAIPWLVEVVEEGARVIARAAEEWVARKRRPQEQQAAAAVAGGAAAAGGVSTPAAAAAARTQRGSGAPQRRKPETGPSFQITHIAVYEGLHRLRGRQQQDAGDVEECGGGGSDAADGVDGDDMHGRDPGFDDGASEDEDDEEFGYGRGGGGGGRRVHNDGYGGDGYMSDGYGGDNPFRLPRARFDDGGYGYGGGNRRREPRPEWEEETRWRERQPRGPVRGAHAAWLAALSPLAGCLGRVCMREVALAPGHIRVLHAACPDIEVLTEQPEIKAELQRIRAERKNR